MQKICYNILIVINQEYFELSKIFLNSFFQNVDLDKINNIFIGNIGLENKSIEYFKAFSRKIKIINT